VKIRAALQDWQAILAGLVLNPGKNLTERQSALAALRMTLYFFKTYAMDHCRREENVFFRMFASSPGLAAKLLAFRDGHERLGIDLDKFERQMASYQLSGDPTVLLTLENAPSANWASTSLGKRSLRQDNPSSVIRPPPPCDFLGPSSGGRLSVPRSLQESSRGGSCQTGERAEIPLPQP